VGVRTVGFSPEASVKEPLVAGAGDGDGEGDGSGERVGAGEGDGEGRREGDGSEKETATATVEETETRSETARVWRSAPPSALATRWAPATGIGVGVEVGTGVGLSVADGAGVPSGAPGNRRPPKRKTAIAPERMKSSNATIHIARSTGSIFLGSAMRDRQGDQRLAGSKMKFTLWISAGLHLYRLRRARKPGKSALIA